MVDRSKRVAILGQLPPPYGGISVHLARLVEHLCREETPFCFYDLLGQTDPGRNVLPGARNPAWLARYLLAEKEPFTHLHAVRMPVIMLATLALAARGRGTIVTLHNDLPRRWYLQANRLTQRMWRNAVSRMRHLFCVNESLREWLIGLGVPPERVSHSPAFIPPAPRELDESNLSTEVQRFLDRHSPILASHGWYGDFLDGAHVYSFDMLAELVSRLRQSWPRAGLITVVSGTFDPAHRQRILELRGKLGVEDRWLLVETPFAAASLFSRSDVFLRPTVTDGDSVSVRECLGLGVPVVASDAVARPAGCVLFGNRDLPGLVSATQEVLQQPEVYRQRARAVPVVDASRAVIEVYRRLLQVG